MNNNLDYIDDDMQRGYDFDWYFVDNNNNVAMVASYMGNLPKSVAGSRSDNELLVDFFQTLPVISPKVIIIKNTQPQLVDTDHQPDDSFTKMAKRGLFAFDKYLLNKPNDDLYKIVARPTTLLSSSNLPTHIKDIVERTRYYGDITNINELRVRDIT